MQQVRRHEHHQLLTVPLTGTAPAEGGAWSLQVFARVGTGRDAAWYWRVEVAP